jgi:hypothetical protein
VALGSVWDAPTEGTTPDLEEPSMTIRHRIAAAVATVGLAATGLVLVAPAAQAAPLPQAAAKTCTIEGFTPGSVTLGLMPKEVKFAPKTSGCTVTSWSISTSSFQATNKNFRTSP